MSQAMHFPFPSFGQVEYPFHDTKPERVSAHLIRRARILKGGKWQLLKPGQSWACGKVTSPHQLVAVTEEQPHPLITPHQEVRDIIRKATVEDAVILPADIKQHIHAWYPVEVGPAHCDG